MTKYIVLAVALLVGGCESEAPEASEADAGAAVAVDCGAAEDATGAVEPDAQASPELPVRAIYDVNFTRTSDNEPGSCGFDFDWFANRLIIDGATGAWSADTGAGLGERAPLTIQRTVASFRTSPTDAIQDGINYPFGPCMAEMSGSSWSCEMYRHWVEADGAVKCLNRYHVTGAPLVP